MTHSWCTCCGVWFKTKLHLRRHSKVCSDMQGIEKTSKFKKKRTPLNKALRYSVWNSTFGERIAFGPCCCCRREVTQQTFEVGHVVAVAKGGQDAFDNLRVVCRTCNASMGSTNMDDWKSAMWGLCPHTPCQGGVPPPWTPLNYMRI